MKFIVTLIIVLCYAFAFAQDSVYIKTNYEKFEYMIKMRDGKKLYTAVFVPRDKSKKYPILLNRTPYSCQPYGKNAYPNNLGPGSTKKYTDEKFIFVKQDVRGRFMSEGEFEDVRAFETNKTKKTTIDEASDTYDAVDWLVKNIKECNGKVGVYGISYPGFYASMAALAYHPAIKAVSPQAPVTNWFLGDDVRHNGAFFLFDTFSFDFVFGKPRYGLTTKWRKGFTYPTPDAYDFYLKHTLKELTEKYMDSCRFWMEEMAHPNYDAFWKARDIRPHFKNIKCAVLTVGGLYDAEDCWGGFETYKWIEKQNPGIDNKLVEGPWFHGGWARSDGSYFGDIRFGRNTSEDYLNELEFPFFMHYLKDDKNYPLAEATLFDIGADQWRKFDEWPVKTAETKKLYFHENGKLNFTAPEANSGYTEYVSDPENPVPFTNEITNRRSREYMIEDQRFADRRPDVISFTTDELEEDITLAGPLYADLMAAITGTDADFIVKLIDVYPDSCSNYELNGKTVKLGGYQMLVRGEVMRARFRKSFEQPEAMVPNKTEEVRFYLPDVMHTFKKGHKIMVQVQSSWFPLVERNPQQFIDTYKAEKKDFIKSTQRIYHQKNAASYLEINVLK